MSHLVVIAGVSTLRSLIVAVATVGELELSTLASQGVDATLEIDVQSRSIVDCQRLLRRNVGVRGVRRMPQALLVNLQEARKVNGRESCSTMCRSRSPPCCKYQQE